MKLKTTLLAAALTVAATFAGAPSAEAVVISLSPSTKTVQVGDTAVINLVVDRQGANLAIGAWTAAIKFDAAIVSIASGDISYGSELETSMKGTPDTSTAGWIKNLWELSLEDSADLLASQPQEFTLATLKFKADAVGETMLMFDFDCDCGISDEDGTDITERVTFNGGKIIVRPKDGGEIPEPSRALAIGAMVVIGVFRRSRR